MYAIPGFATNQHLILQEPNPANKNKKYYLQNVMAMYSEYLRGASSIGYEGMTRIELLRSYAEGRQVQRKFRQEADSSYSPLLDTNGNPIKREVEDDPTVGVNPYHPVWEILSPANKIMDALYGTLSRFEYEVSADPLDYATRQELEDNKLRTWVFKQNLQKIDTVAKMADLQIPMPEFLPESPEDLDQFETEFMPVHVRAIEKVLKHSFDISHWLPNTKLLFYRDLIATGMACVKNDYDPEDGKVKPRYVDIKFADIQKSNHIDCRDSERAWEFRLYSISQIRQYFPDKPEEWFEKIARNYCSLFDNPSASDFSGYTKQDPWGRWLYDPFKVPVMTCEWIDVNTYKEAIGTKNGKRTVKEVPLGKTVPSTKTVRFRDERMRYEAKWVLGSDEVFEYGPAYDVTYPSKNDTELTYKWIVLPGKSKIEQLLPILVNFQDLWDRLREQLRNAQGKIQFIDVDQLSSVQGETDTPQVAAKKAFRRFLRTNKLMFRRVNAAGMPNQNRPIEELDGGMGSIFVEIQASLKTNMELVEYISGVNPLALGQSADPNAPVTTSQMAMNATVSVLRPLAEGYQLAKTNIADNLARWITVLVRGNEFSRKAYEEAIGKYEVQSIIAANRDEASYGIKLTPRPTEIEQQWLLQNLTVATTPAQGGEREISTSDANYILNMIASGSPMKTIQHYFERARRKQRAIIMQEKQMLMQQQSQLNQQDATVSGQARMQENDQVHRQQMELQVEKNRGVIDNSTIQENIRREKEKEVAAIKQSAPKPEKVEAT